MARFIQGTGGALGLPVGRLIIFRTFGRQALIPMMNRVITLAALGMMLGPVVGGFITHYFSWRWIFWINIPIGIIAIISANYCLEDNVKYPVPSIDKLGFMLFSIALTSFILGFSELSDKTANNQNGFYLVMTSIVFLMGYARHSRYQLHPVIKMDLFKLRTFKISVVGHLLSRLGFGGVPFILPLFLQIGLGYPSEISGMTLAPIAIGVLVAKPFHLPLLRTYGYKRLLMINTILVALSTWTFIMINASTVIFIICLLTFFYGFTVALQYGLMNSLAYADITPENMSAASSIMGTIQQVALSLGVAVSALFIRLFSLHYSPDVTPNPIIFYLTFFAVGLITFISFLVFIQLKKDDGHQMIA